LLDIEKEVELQSKGI